MLKVLRWLLPLMLLISGCGLLPTGSTPTQSAATPGGATSKPAAGAPTQAGGTAASSPGSGPAAPPPTPSPSPSPTPIPRTTVRLGTSSSLGGWVVDVAERQGYFAVLGIDLDRKETDPGSAATAEDVEKRERDIGVVATDRLIQHGKNGQSLVMVAGLVNEATYSLIAARDVPDIGALKGKPIGYLDEKSAAAAILKRMLEVKGIPEAETPLISFPDPGVVGAAVANGTVGASLVDPARAGRLRGSGFDVLVEANEVARDYQAEGLVVRPEWARQNEDLLTRFIRATIQAQQWINAPANKGAAIEQLSRSLGVSPDEAKIVYEQYVEQIGAIPPAGDIDQAGVRGVIELLTEIGEADDPRPDAARLTDTAWLQRARPSGSQTTLRPASPAPSPSPARPASPVSSPSPSPAPR